MYGPDQCRPGLVSEADDDGGGRQVAVGVFFIFASAKSEPHLINDLKI